MYAFELSDSTGKNAGGTVLTLPAYEVNYGVVPNVQLHLVLPMTTVFAPSGGPTNFGYSDTEVGAKVRFVKETAHLPEVGIFPFFEFPSGNSDKGLGVGSTWYRMPLWLQKSWGAKDRQWTSYGGGGATVFSGAANADGFDNFPFAGWLVQRQLSEKLTLGGELFGHGAEGPAATSTRSSIMADLGGIYEFHDGFDLLFAAGRSVHASRRPTPTSRSTGRGTQARRKPTTRTVPGPPAQRCSPPSPACTCARIRTPCRSRFANS